MSNTLPIKQAAKIFLKNLIKNSDESPKKLMKALLSIKI